MKHPASTNRLGQQTWRFGAVFILGLPLLLGWHPVPTLGSIAEVGAVFATAVVLVMAPLYVRLNWRAFLLGTGGVLLLLFLRAMLSPAIGQDVYTGLWVGPLVVIGVGLIICCAWPQTGDGWLRVVAASVLLAALVNALVGFFQYWRITALFEALGPYVVYWDRDDAVAHGNVAQRNILASLCLLGLAASIYLNPRQRLAIRLMELFLVYAMALTASRTPLLIVGVVAAVTIYRQRGWALLQAPLVTRFVVPVLLLQFLGPLFNDLVSLWLQRPPVESAASRLGSVGLGIRVIFYQLASEIGIQWWAWGGGWKSLPQAMVEHGFAHAVWGKDELPTHAHNLLLHLWAENGLPLALLASLYPLWLMARRGAETVHANYARLSIAVLWAHAMVEFPLWQPALFFLFVGLCRALELAHQAPANDPDRAGYRHLGLIFRSVAMLTALGSALTVWQLVVVAQLWTHIVERRIQVQISQVTMLRKNPVVEPYADWLELNLNTDTPARRVARLERLAHWIPDSMMLGLLADAYRRTGQQDQAHAIERRRAVVFGIGPDQ